jgi:hypothetical protein
MMAELSRDDQARRAALQAQVQSRDLKYVRSCGVSLFGQTVATLLAFCQRNTRDAWKRFFACGICPVAGGVAIHTRRLAARLGRSKSAVNTGMKAMGLDPVPVNSCAVDEISRVLHTQDREELRCWTIRRTVTPESRPPPHPLPPAATERTSPEWDAELPVEEIEWFL